MEGEGGREAATEGRPGGERGGQARVSGLAARAGGTGRGAFIRLCRATDQGAALPHQDRWRGRPCHVNGQPVRSSPRQPPAAPWQ